MGNVEIHGNGCSCGDASSTYRAAGGDPSVGCPRHDPASGAIFDGDGEESDDVQSSWDGDLDVTREWSETPVMGDPAGEAFRVIRVVHTNGIIVYLPCPGDETLEATIGAVSALAHVAGITVETAVIVPF